MQEIINSKEITHRLTVKTSGGETRKIYLDKDKAKIILKNINSSEQFIVIADTQEAFPKFGATLERLTERKLAWIRGKHQRKTLAEAKLQERKLELEKTARENKVIDDWIENHSEEYDRMVGKELKEIDSKNLVSSLPTQTKRKVAEAQVKLQIKNILNEN